MKIKFKNGSKIESIESKDSKRSYPTRIKFGEWETITPSSSKEIDRNRILMKSLISLQNKLEKALKLMLYTIGENRYTRELPFMLFMSWNILPVLRAKFQRYYRLEYYT